MPHEAELEQARAAVEAEQQTLAAWEDAQRARDEAVRTLYDVAADDMSQNEMARRVGLTGSTLRAITTEQRRARRATRPRE